MRAGQAILAACLLAATVSAAAEPGFSLRERLGRTWSNECVSFPLTDAHLAAATAGRALLGPDGKAVAYQLASEAGTTRILFQTDLQPDETRTFRFGEAKESPATDLKIEDAADVIRVANGLTGIAIRKKPAPGQGPIEGVRLPSGTWVGGSRLTAEPAPTAYSARVLAKGPVMAEVEAKAEFAEGSFWTVRFRVYAREPVVLVDETSAMQGQAELTVSLSDGFAPDTLLYRRGNETTGPLGRNLTWRIEPGPVYTLEAWLHWSERERQGNCFGLYKESGTDLLGVGAREAGAWVDPALKREDQAPTRIAVVREGDEVRMALPLRQGQRKWMFMALKKDEALKDIAANEGAFSLPNYRLLIKHGHFPLDLVKDYALEWKGDGKPHPRLFITPAQVETFRKNANLEAHAKAIPGLLERPLNTLSPDEAIMALFATGDPKLGDHLTRELTRMLDDIFERLVDQPGPPFGAAPHHYWAIGVATAVADVVLSRPDLDPATRAKILARFAFLGYTMERPDFWSPARGYAANPNMTSSVYGYKASIACLIPSHPRANEWVKDGLAELKSQIETWSDANGGWLEAPHYATVSFDQILGVFIMARNAGFADELYSPKMKAVISWFGKISTPPDSRLGGWRHLPPIGNTYLLEPSGSFGVIAGLWKERDPEFASHMQWMWQQHGRFPQPGVGGAFPALAGFRRLIEDSSIPAKPPPWKSELFPETGVVLRHNFPSDRETMLHMIAGDNHAHYDYDSGSITLWGRGRILADDFGYTGRAPREDHAMLQTEAGASVMKIKEFQAGERLDYVRGVAGTWTRQIALVKEPGSEAAYFLMLDTQPQALPSIWRLWSPAASVKPEPQAARVEGKDDVDLDLFFLLPRGVTPTTAEKKINTNVTTVKAMALERMDFVQQGVILEASAKAFSALLFPRLKTEAPPAVAPLADGLGAKVTTALGTDYVFLSRKPFAFKGEGVEFEGTAGCVQLRGDKAHLSLGAPGRIACKGQEVKSGSVTVHAGPDNLIENGDFETGLQDVFKKNYGPPLEIVKGNPAPSDKSHAGAFCLAMEEGGMGSSNHGILDLHLVVDPRRTYRLSLKYFSAFEFHGGLGGYGQNEKENVRLPDGSVFEWNLGCKGPTAGWTAASMTIGPPGSGADAFWPPDTIRTTVRFAYNGLESGGLIYLDDIEVVEVLPIQAKTGK